MLTIARLPHLHRAGQPLPAALLLVAAILVAIAVAMVVAVAAPGHDDARRLNVLVEVAGLVAASGVVFLGWTAFSALGLAELALIASAYLAFVVACGLRLVDSLAGPGIRAELGLMGEASAYAATAARLVGFATITVAFLISRGAPIRLRRPGITVMCPAMVAILASIIVVMAEPRLPAITVTAVSGEASGSETFAAPALTATGVAVHGLVILVAAAALAVAWRAHAAKAGPSALALLTGLALGVLAELDGTFRPSVEPMAQTTADLLTTASSVMVAIAIVLATRDGVRRLRSRAATIEGNHRAAHADELRAERTRLARDVHDGLAQDLWLARLQLEGVDRAASLEEARSVGQRASLALESAIGGARGAIDRLRVPTDEHLEPILGELASRFATRTGLAIELAVDPGLSVRPDARVELALIVSEALANVGRHARASRVRIAAIRRDEHIEVAIQDDGAGTAEAVLTEGYGITGMRERATSFGGTIEISSTSPHGTTVSVLLPDSS